MAEPVRYHISLEHRRQHLVTVRVVVPADCAAEATLTLPCWTPGSYLRRDYVRHLQTISAVDATGAEVALTPIGGDTWQLPATVDGPVTVTLELFANDLSVRTNSVDDTAALIIPAATCLQVAGATSRPHHVTVSPTSSQISAHALLHAHDTDPDTFVADDYDHLVDAAFSVGTHATVTCDVDGVAHHVVWAGGTGLFDAEVATDAVTKLARACQNVFDTPLPMGQYTFLVMTGETGSGGLEHRDGAVLHVPETTFTKPESIARFQSLVAHEYLHAWNVKRLTPTPLLNLRYDDVVRTTSLWFAEGFTAYYDGLLCVRAGLWDDERLLSRFSGIFTNLTHTPGTALQSLHDASWRAPERQYRRDENAVNAMTEYYAHGSLVAFELDCLLRSENPDGDGLDDLMRLMWGRFLHTGYTDEDVFWAAETLAGKTVANRLRQRVMNAGVAPADELADALHTLGLTLTSQRQTHGTLGVQIASTPPPAGVRLAAAFRGGPAWNAGLVGRDVILALNDTVVTPDTFEKVMAGLAPSDTITVSVLRHNRIDTCEVTLSPANLTYTISVDPTADGHAAFNRWLHRHT